jgi:flagellar basal-body rod protein FlgB
MIERVATSVEGYLDLLSLRQKLISSNIANADTPGYRTRDVDFQTEFRRVLEHQQPSIGEVPGLNLKNDGNNVSMDRETWMLAETALRFNLASSLAKAELRHVRMAIEEGRNG